MQGVEEGALGQVPVKVRAGHSGLFNLVAHRTWLLSMFVLLASGLLMGLWPKFASADTDLWSGLRSGEYVALLRHALAPGTGDPPHFALGDCSTQRNLSDEGRAQARRIGARFRENGIDRARVFSSQWCRCLETAELLGLGPVEDLPMLNSFYQRSERQDQQTRALKAWLERQELEGPLVLVTHQVNMTALTGVFPSSGELVIFRLSDSGQVSPVGTIETD